MNAKYQKRKEANKELYKEKLNALKGSLSDFKNETASRFYLQKDLVRDLKEMAHDCNNETAELDALAEIRFALDDMQNFIDKIENNLI